MANQDWKSITITFVVAALILHYFLAAPVENKCFQISKNHIKYHANWTSHFSQLEHVNQLQEAYKLDNIESIDIAFSMSNLDLESIRRVFPTQFKQYRKIKINLANNPIGTLGADYILSLIPNQVEQLQVSFDAIDADLQLGNAIVKRLNNLNSLKKLKLSLILAAKNDSVIDDYFRYGRIGKRLQSYSLIFIGNSLTSKSVGSLEDHLSRANLKNLELNFYANKLGAEGAQIVSKAIKSQKNLQSLAVDFYFNNLTEIGTKAITQAIEEINNPNLKSLLLNLDFNYIEFGGSKYVGNLLACLTNIESLHLGVASKNFGFNGFKNIVNGLSNLTQLKQLNLRVGVNRIGYSGAAATKDLLFKLKNLVVLNLNLYENYITDQGVVDVIQGVVSLQQLEKLSLNLGFSDAKGYGFIHALKALAKKTFKQLYLGFSSNEIKDFDAKLVINDLENIIKKTKVFEFQFMETAISKKQQWKFEKLFENGKLYKNKAVIHVNSVITEQLQKKYQQEGKSRQKSHETVNQNKKAQKTKKQQTIQKQRTVEKKADEAIELDGQQTKTVSNQDNNYQQRTEQKTSEQATIKIQHKIAQKEQQKQTKQEQPIPQIAKPVEEKVQSPVETKEEQPIQTNKEQTTVAISVETVQVKEQKLIEVESVQPTADKPAALQAVQTVASIPAQQVEAQVEQSVVPKVELPVQAIQEQPSVPQIKSDAAPQAIKPVEDKEEIILDLQATVKNNQPQVTKSVDNDVHQSNEL